MSVIMRFHQCLPASLRHPKGPGPHKSGSWGKKNQSSAFHCSPFEPGRAPKRVKGRECVRVRACVCTHRRGHPEVRVGSLQGATGSVLKLANNNYVFLLFVRKTLRSIVRRPKSHCLEKSQKSRESGALPLGVPDALKKDSQPTMRLALKFAFPLAFVS